MRGNRRLWAIPLIVAASASPGAAAAAPSASSTARAAATAPVQVETAAATTPTAKYPTYYTPVPSDFSSPAATAKTLLTAINHADFATVVKCLDIPAARDGDITAFLCLMEASAHLQRAAADKFLAAGVQAFGAPSPELLADQLKALETATAAIRGTTASLAIPADTASQLPGGTLELKQIGPDWKIDAASFFKLNHEPADQTATRIALSAKLLAITTDLTKEIQAGKFFSATDAYQEYWTRCRQATQPPPATTPAPATNH